MVKGIVKVGDNLYHFGEISGKLKYGWSQTLDGYNHYSSSDGKMYTGIKKIDGDSYYFDETSGNMVKGIVKVGDDLYHFGEISGKLKYGFSVTLNNEHYYSDENGVIQKLGWFEMDGFKYYSDPETGVLGNGITVIDNNMYHFGENSNQLKYGFSVTLNNEHYYSDENGVIQKLGWFEMDGFKYYSDPETGVLGNGITVIDNNMYHFGENSNQLKYGFSKLLNGNRYYSDENGVIVKGIQIINGNRYHFGENSGQLKLGWSKALKGDTYYSDVETGIIYTGSLLIDHAFYNFDENGILVSSSAKKYIDVSAWQGNINWSVVRNSYVDGAIIRIGYGSSNSDPCTKDRFFDTNYYATAPYNFLKGFYLYSYAINPESARKEAEFVISELNRVGAGKSIPIFYDLESNRINAAVSPFMFEEMIKSFIFTLNNAGFNNVSVYTYKNFAETNLTEFGRNQITWIAQYGPNLTYKGSYNGWQYTSNGSVPGINGAVDISVFR